MPITVITGPPGAGKTTISAALARSKHRGVHLPTDHWYHWIVAGYVPPWKPQANAQNTTVIEAIASSAARYSAGGYHVVVDGIIGLPGSSSASSMLWATRPPVSTTSCSDPLDRSRLHGPPSEQEPGPNRSRTDHFHVRRLRGPRLVRTSRGRYDSSGPRRHARRHYPGS